ncbi:MAG TPA: hypothetical protein VGJ91_14625, partial [Polyangiaceae bacterium]
MKQRRAVLALVISIVVLAAFAGWRLRAQRGAPRARPIPSAAAVHSVPPSPPPAPSASASASATPPSPVRPPAPPYLDTSAKTLAEQRSALFTNMQNQLDLPAGALDKIEAIFAASHYLGQGEPKITK